MPSPPSFIRRAPLLAALALVCVARDSAAQATCSLTDCTIGGVVNTYWPSPGTASYAAGSRKIAVDNANKKGAANNIAAGDLLVVMQMQDAAYTLTNSVLYGDGAGATGAPPNGSPGGYTGTPTAGKYEYVVAEAALGTAVPAIAACSGVNATAANEVCISSTGASSGLVNSYVAQDLTTAQDRKSYQVVRAIQCNNMTLSANITAYAWDGRAGGVIVLEPLTNLNFAGFQVNASGGGFRGGDGRFLGCWDDRGPGRFNNDDTLPINSGCGTAANFDPVPLLTYAKDAGKGEGISGTPNWIGALLNTSAGAANTSCAGGTTACSYRGDPGTGVVLRRSDGRGAPGNAGGGGTRDTGGGGGANGGAGGIGGDRVYYTDSGTQFGILNGTNHTIGIPAGFVGEFMGGHGGGGFATGALGQLALGGGGGGGYNHSPATNHAHGGYGGGIVLVRAGGITNATNAVDMTSTPMGPGAATTR